jgi:hypothetical protein
MELEAFANGLDHERPVGLRHETLEGALPRIGLRVSAEGRIGPPL